VGASSTSAAGVATVVEIAPPSGLLKIDFGELRTYRELLYFLVWRDVKVRYKQTALGAAWAILQPLLTMGVFSIFLGRLAHVPSDGIPYPLFSFAALVPWTYFATAVSGGSLSIVGSQQLISKVYFPRLFVPLAAALTPLVDFAVAMAMLVVLMWRYRVAPGAAVVCLPALVVLAVLTALAVSLWLSVLMVKFRDIRYVVPFAIQFWMFATPVAYPASLVPARWRPLYGLNPMTGVVEGFRWALVGGPAPGAIVWLSALVVLLALAAGLVYFRSEEGLFADTI
jgi:lipopolysaccharide transport system permease protein